MAAREEIVVEEPWLRVGCTLGEGPIYDPMSSILHFVDISGKRVTSFITPLCLISRRCKHQIFHVDTVTTEVKYEQFEESITCLSLREKDSLLACAAAQGFAVLPGDSRLEYISKPLPAQEVPHTRFNDGGCDSKGRFFAGTLYSPKHDIPGRLYKYDPFDKICSIADPGPFTVCLWLLNPLPTERMQDSNGLGWSPDEKIFYFTDSLKNIIYAYDYDDGKLANRRIFVDAMALGLPKNTFCDGLCVDREGFVWSCRWGGSQIVRFTREGAIDLVVRFPKVLNVTACCFGGPNNDQLFVTSAHCQANDGDASLQEKYPDSGHVFRVDLSSRGLKGGIRHKFTG
ncbi:Regucalcin [Leucoagaricus sp. SymC.cos]|nr:Regucalcin [Leucoagaricus sp. SymC.cos]